MNVTEAIPIVERVAANKLGLGVHEREALRVVLEAAVEWSEKGP